MALDRLGGMNDTKLYEQILGLQAPWSVQSVTLKKAGGIIEIEVGCEETLWGCPECGQRMHKHDTKRRSWRHMDTCQFKTVVVTDVPRVKCPQHGTLLVRVPWAEPLSRFTTWFERLAIDVLQECSTAAACDHLRITWDEADGIKQRAIDRGLRRRQVEPLRQLCIDEKAVGWGHRYVTIVSCADGKTARVVAIEDDRQERSLNRFWRSLTKEQLTGIETVAMDMWKAYRNSTLRFVPGAEDKIVYDNFHVAKHMNKAVDDVRRNEHAFLQADGDETLKGTRQLWLYGFENVPRKWASRFKALREALTKTARAWKVKELLRSLWRCEEEGEATAYFKAWCREAMATRLEPVKKVVRMLKTHWTNIVTYFRHHLCNAAAEGINSRIQHLIQKACGYRNRDRFKRDVLFHLGRLDLYPVIVQ
jgi:transposase